MTFDELERRTQASQQRDAVRRERNRRRKWRERAMCKRLGLCERCLRSRAESPSKQMCVDCLIYRRLYVRQRQGSVSYGERQEGRHPGGRPPFSVVEAPHE